MQRHDIDEMAFQIHDNSVAKGFWDQNTPENFPLFYLKQIAMIHSEASETLEAIRKEKGDAEVVDELADTMIRVMDLWAGMVRDGYTKIRLSDAIDAKMAKNTTRPPMHGVLA